MKKIIFITAVWIYALATSCAQSTPPAAVTTAFNQKFPNAKDIKWDKENEHEFEAAFDWQGEKYSANFSDNGIWLETESTYTFNQLPEKVQTAFNTSNEGATIKAVAKIETSKGEIKYEVEFKKGIMTVELFYNAEGTELKN